MWNVNKTPFTPWLATRFCINSLETLTSLFCLSFLKCAQLKLGADGFPALSSFVVSGNHFGYQWFFSPKEFGRDAKLNVQGCTESTLNVCLIASNRLSPVISRTGDLSFISAAGTRWLTAHLLDTVVLPTLDSVCAATSHRCSFGIWQRWVKTWPSSYSWADWPAGVCCWCRTVTVWFTRAIVLL